MSYLLEDARARVLGNLERTLKPGGWLVLGAGETAPCLSPIAERPGFHGRAATARAA
jgi:chemotaxis methyl-accepting protein methylase